MLTRSGLSGVVRDSLLLAPSYVVPGLASLISVPVLFVLLGADGYGRWALIFGIANGVPQVTTSWLESLVLRFGHRSDQAIRGSLYVVAPVASAVAGLVLAIVFIPAASQFVAISTAILTVTVGAYLIVIARLQSLLRFGAASRVAVVRATTGAVLSIAAAAVLHESAAAALGLAAGFALGTLDGLLIIRRQGSRESVAGVEGVAERSTPREMRVYGFGAAVFAAGSFILAVGDRFVLSMLRPLAEVGIYAATYTIADLVFRLGPSVLVATVRQRLFRSWDAGNGQSRSAAVVAGVLVLAWVMAAGVVAIIAIGPRIPALPIDAVLIGPIAAGLATFIVANALVVVYSAQIRQGRVAIHVAIAACLNLGLNVLLVPSMGALGAALTTVIGYVVFLVLNLAGIRSFLAGSAAPATVYPILVALILTMLLATVWSGPATWAVASGLSAVALVMTLPFLVRLVRPLLATA